MTTSPITQPPRTTRADLDATLGLVPVILGGPSPSRTRRPRRPLLGLGAGRRTARGAAAPVRPEPRRFLGPR